MKRAVLLSGLLLALAVPAALGVQKERLLTAGARVLLPLAPTDPRSLIQGDYMALRYAAARDAERTAHLPVDGHLVLRLGPDRVATFVRVDDGSRELGPDEILLRYRRRDGNVQLGAESYFFQEGEGAVLEAAKYGELRVGQGGESILVGLCDREKAAVGRRVGYW